MKKTALVVAVLLVAAATWVFANGSKESSGGSTTMSSTSGGKVGGQVSVIAVWQGNELDIFNNMIKPFEDQTGVNVQYEATRDLASVLTTRVQAGNPPDVASMPGLGAIAQYAGQGKLVDLSTVLDMSTINQNYAKGWIDLGTVNGKYVALVTGASLKGLIWYNPQTFKAAGLTVPTTWDQLMQESQKIAATGVTPWAIGLESGAASGWAGADWIQEIVLKKYGPDIYTQWYQGKLPWTSSQIKDAFQIFGQIATNPKMTYGGTQYELSTNFGTAFDPVFQNPPKAYFHQQATFIQSFIQKDFPNAQAGTDFAFFPFPSIDPRYASAVQSAGDLMSEFNKTPQANAFVNYFSTADAQAFWVKAGDKISVNKAVSLSDYPDAFSKQAAQILTSAQVAEFSADDLMPSQMENAFWKGILNYLSDPSSLDSVLQNLDQVRQSAYSGS